MQKWNLTGSGITHSDPWRDTLDKTDTTLFLAHPQIMMPKTQNTLDMVSYHHSLLASSFCTTLLIPLHPLSKQSSTMHYTTYRLHYTLQYRSLIANRPLLGRRPIKSQKMPKRSIATLKDRERKMMQFIKDKLQHLLRAYNTLQTQPSKQTFTSELGPVNTTLVSGSQQCPCGR